VLPQTYAKQMLSASSTAIVSDRVRSRSEEAASGLSRLQPTDRQTVEVSTELYQDPGGLWRWRLRDSRSRVVAASVGGWIWRGAAEASAQYAAETEWTELACV
jgi:uncharacterized protein YegP (UPF0339 family)